MDSFSLRVTAADGDVADAAAIERFALDLRAELADLNVSHIEAVSAGPAPEGARALELLAVFEFIITMGKAGESVNTILDTVRRVAERYTALRHRFKVTVADVEVDLADAKDDELRKVISAVTTQAAATQAVIGGVRKALIIANKEFDDPALTQLRAPTYDAEALARVLGSPAIGGFDVELLTDSDERTVRLRIAAFFADHNRDDVLLLHFSGHGVKDARGRLYLTARDTKLSLLSATGIPASFVSDQMAESQSNRIVLILDCCYSGAFARGTAVRADDSVHVADEFGAGNGRIVLTASSATEYAFEGTELTRSDGQPSAFTSALVSGLDSGEADLDADGEISIDELYDYTYRRVRATTPGQAPMKWTFGVEGNLVIARSVRPAILPRSILDDIDSDRIVLRLEAVTALTQIFRTGKPGLRAAAQTTLVTLRDHDDSSRVRAAAATALGAPAFPPAAPPTPTLTDRPVPGAPAAPGAPVPPATRTTATGRATPPISVPPSTPASAAPSAPAPAAPISGAAASGPPAAPASAAPTFAPAPAAPISGAPVTGRATAPASQPVRATPSPATSGQVATPSPVPAQRSAPGTAPTPGVAAASPARSGAALPAVPGTGVDSRSNAAQAIKRPRAGVPEILAGIVALVAEICFIKGFSHLSETTATLLSLPPMISATLLLISRQQRYAAIMVGALAWQWVLPISLEDNSVEYELGDLHKIALIGNLLAICALGLGALVLLRRVLKGDLTAPPLARVGAVVLVLPLAIVVSIGVARGVIQGVGASTDTAAGWVYDIGLVSGLILAAFVIAAPRSSIARDVAYGWLVAGAELGIYASDHDKTSNAWTLWPLLVALTGATVLVLWTKWPERPKPTT